MFSGKILIGFIILALVLAGCGDEVSVNSDSTGEDQGSDEWLIEVTEVYDGGPGRDGIPALTMPTMVDVSSINYLGDQDLVIGIKIGNDIRAYPHPILDWHEIINDEAQNISYAITYCPLTGSGIGWNRELEGVVTTFGVSGLLYNTNLIPYDRGSGSNWSQMLLKSVNGPLQGENAGLIPIIETSWATWKEMYPNSKVVSTSTGYSRSYGSYPYGDYRTNNSKLLFPINNDDTRLPRKERVLGIISGSNTKVFRFAQFPEGIGIVEDQFDGKPIVVVGSSGKNIIVAYSRILADGTELSFTPLENQLPLVMMDNEGNSWDIFGVAIGGVRLGEKLISPPSFISYWFAWGTFYPGAEIHGM